MHTNHFISLRTGKSYPVVFTDNPPSGADREVFFAPDRSYAIGVFKETPDEQHIRKLDALVFHYRDQVLRGKDATESAQLEKLFCWPFDVVTKDGFVGVVFPTFPSCFFFNENHAVISKGQEKRLGWFIEPYHKFFHVSPTERGDFKDVFHCAFQLARGIRRLHSLGLVHPDISWSSVLIDPITQSTLITSCLDIAVSGLYEADLIGPLEYNAPEIVAAHARGSSVIPSLDTDKHSLAVLIYQLLLCRHPLKGKRRFDEDDSDYRELGVDALFIENQTDRSTRYDVEWVRNGMHNKKHPYIFPWMDLDKLPYVILGPYLSDLIERAFVNGLHSPKLRPTAAEWEYALERTVPLLRHCANSNCPARWFVARDDSSCKCPFCS